MEKRPNFFIVGVPKAGTTSLYCYLTTIKGIYLSPIKEPNYFSVSTIPNNYHRRPIRDKKEYFSLFEKVKDEKIIGEASPLYLSDPQAPKLIHDTVPDAKIIISLRDPVDRLFSNYLMLVRLGWLKLSFLEELKIEFRQRMNDARPHLTPHLRIEASLYSENVKRYLDIFGEKQVKIIIFEEWIHDPKTTIEEILRFLGLNPSVNYFKNEIHNPFVVVRGPVVQKIFTNVVVVKIAKTLIPQSTRTILRDKVLFKKQPKPKMDQESKQMLVKYYHDDVEKLQTIIGRKLPWPNF